MATAGDGGRVTRHIADPLTVKPRGGRLEIRRNFFSNRVPAPWNRIPISIPAGDRNVMNRRRHARKAVPDGDRIPP